MDPRLRAVWLEGSLGQGSADRYSDVDLHVLVGEAELPAFQTEVETWLGQLQPLVLFNRLFGGQMINALTADGLRVDLWLHSGEQMELVLDRMELLHALPGAVLPARERPAPTLEVTAQRLLGLIQEFWRCITLLPAVLGREERLVALQGLMVELGLVTELLIVGEGVVRDRGVKNLNAFLAEDVRRDLEAGLPPADLSAQALADAHLRLAGLVQERGPALAARHGFTYPAELERTALTYAAQELEHLGLILNGVRLP